MIDVRLAPGPEAPGSARSALERLRDRVPSNVLDDVRLLVSELVTNSVRHAGLSSDDRVELRVEVTPSTIRVEVTDPGRGFAQMPPTPTPYQDHGWGLYLVGQIADRWGVDREGGTAVWFEIDSSRSATS